jgi:hypothetical protein
MSRLAEPGLGHNQPPSDPLERAGELVANANRWIKERPEIADEEQAGSCQLAIEQLRTVKADLEAAEKSEREPYDKLIGAIRIKYRDPLSLVGIALTRLQQIAGAWLTKKRDRAQAEAAMRQRAAEEAAQKANEAIEKAVAEPSVEHDLAAQKATAEAEEANAAAGRGEGRAQIKGDYAGRAMSLHAYWSAEITDEALALRSYAKHPDIRAAALVAVRKVAGKEARTLKDETKAKPGIRFVKTEKPV